MVYTIQTLTGIPMGSIDLNKEPEKGDLVRTKDGDRVVMEVNGTVIVIHVDLPPGHSIRVSRLDDPKRRH